MHTTATLGALDEYEAAYTVVPRVILTEASDKQRNISVR